MLTNKDIYDHIENIRKMKKELINSENIKTSLYVMKDIYKYVKDVSYDYYVDGKMIDSYTFVKTYLINCENHLPKVFITKFDNINNSDENEILNWIVNCTRKYLKKTYSKNNKHVSDIVNTDLTNYCDVSAHYINDLCKNNDIKSYIKVIHPGFSKKANIFDGSGYHYINVVIVNNNKYLVDCTYNQFFLLKNNIIDRIDIPLLSGCKAGIYMIMDEKRKEVAKQVLSKGYIKLNEDNIKSYFDGFALSFRNGIYYEDKDYNFNTEYTANDYKLFMNNNDNQVNHEGILTLGKQIRPVKKIKER